MICENESLRETGKCIKQLKKQEVLQKKYLGKHLFQTNLEAVICAPALYLSELVTAYKRVICKDWRTNDA